MTTPITIKEACELLHMERPNVQKLIKDGVIESLGFQKTVGDAWRHLVTKESVEAYAARKLDYSDERAVFKMILPLDIYEKVCRTDKLNDDEYVKLCRAFQGATNQTIRMAEYHAQRRAHDNNSEVTEVDPGDEDDSEDNE